MYWQDTECLTTDAMREWWRDMGEPGEWVLVNWGQHGIQAEGEQGEIAEGAWIRMVGEPLKGWEGHRGVKVAAIRARERVVQREGELVLATIDVQGKLREGDARREVGRYLHRMGADWVVATETLNYEGQSGFGEYAAKFSCVGKEEGGRKGASLTSFPGVGGVT